MWDRSENQITLVLIRHGATKSNEEHRYLGKTDESISPKGEMQLVEYQKLQMFPNIDCLFTSPMKRCVQTAEILYPELQPVQIREWEEMDFGAFEGKNYVELQGDERYQTWIDSNGTLPFPEGESREEFIARCGNGFQRMIEKVKQINKEGHKTIGMIVHGGTIMALLSRYGKGDYFDYQVANGKGYVCTVKNFDTEPEVVELKKI
ncbi:MAG: histidine phosphatase family protein [Lachnospiraceae bacterium]|jgi:alpha-ribazole phosphatase|nr:histidine phosphatase family protein [Lachnospiraceae bacterium]